MAKKNEDPGAGSKKPWSRQARAKKRRPASGVPRGLNSLLSAQVALPSLGLGDLYGFFGRVEAFSARRQLLKSVLDQGVHASVVRVSSTSPVSLWVGQSCLFLLLRNRFSVRFAVASLAFADALPCFFGRQLHRPLHVAPIFFLDARSADVLKVPVPHLVLVMAALSLHNDLYGTHWITCHTPDCFTGKPVGISPRPLH